MNNTNSAHRLGAGFPIAQPSTAQPRDVQPGTAQPGTAQPSTAQPTDAQSTTAQPHKAQHGVTQPEDASANTPQQQGGKPDMRVRTATLADLDALDAVEQQCFPPAEAASRATLEARLHVYPTFFWLLEIPEGADPDGIYGGPQAQGTALVNPLDPLQSDQSSTPLAQPAVSAATPRTGTGGTLVSFVNGIATDEPHLRDDMYDDPALHNAGGAWQMVFGLDTAPQYRRHGYAGLLMRYLIAWTRASQRQGLVLTCKDALVHYYASFGFADEGISDSTHGGVTWHEMRLRF